MEKAEIKEVLIKASVEVELPGMRKVLAIFESDFDKIAEILKSQKDTSKDKSINDVLNEIHQVICIDVKHYTGISKGKTYTVWNSPHFKYPTNKYTHITNDLGLVKSYLTNCFKPIKLNDHNEITIHPVKKSWSREEAIDIAWKAIVQSKIASKEMKDPFTELPKWFDKWIKENL